MQDPSAFKVPPHSEEAEQSVLGGLLLDESAWDRVADLIGSESFYQHAHKVIFQAVGCNQFVVKMLRRGVWWQRHVR